MPPLSLSFQNKLRDGALYIGLNAATAAVTSVTAFAAATHALSTAPSITDMFKVAAIGTAIMTWPRIFPYTPPARAHIRRTVARTLALCVIGGLAAGAITTILPSRQEKQIAQTATEESMVPAVYKPAAP